MASKWRIDGVFWTCALKKRGQVFMRVGLLVDLYSVIEPTTSESADQRPTTASLAIKMHIFMTWEFATPSCIYIIILLYNAKK